MTNTKWFTLGAAAALLSASPALAADARQKGAAESPQGRKVEVTVTGDGFVPAQIRAKPGEVLHLVVTRKVDRTCATELVQKDQNVHAPLPLDKPVAVKLTAPKSGKLTFSCPHGHITGSVVAE